ncbi:hypothetical protein C8Q72DRAFT_212202 [Fomitopsis betulina]|nr:hypothetical protein C8Q72DRAFT_212202 [Fomitopsis betulina]
MRWCLHMFISATIPLKPRCSCRHVQKRSHHGEEKQFTSNSSCPKPRSFNSPAYTVTTQPSTSPPLVEHHAWCDAMTRVWLTRLTEPCICARCSLHSNGGPGSAKAPLLTSCSLTSMYMLFAQARQDALRPTKVQPTPRCLSHCALYVSNSLTAVSDMRRDCKFPRQKCRFGHPHRRLFPIHDIRMMNGVLCSDTFTAVLLGRRIAKSCSSHPSGPQPHGSTRGISLTRPSGIGAYSPHAACRVLFRLGRHM